MNCYYCGCKPNQYTRNNPEVTNDDCLFIRNGIDRIDSTKDHCSGNVVPCCFDCNKYKSNYTIEKFYKWIDDVYENKEKIKNIYNYVEQNNVEQNKVKIMLKFKYHKPTPNNIIVENNLDKIEKMFNDGYSVFYIQKELSLKSKDCLEKLFKQNNINVLSKRRELNMSFSYIAKDPVLSVLKARHFSSYSDMKFDLFLKMIYKNCFYCNSKPTNCLKIKTKNTIDFNLNKIYCNGIDRVNSSLKHTSGNVVTCCNMCNRSKSNMTYMDFLNHIIKIKEYVNPINISNSLILEDHKKHEIPKKKLSTIRRVHYKNYNEMDFWVHYNMSQLNCFYCNEKPNTYTRNDPKIINNERLFVRNGIDRIDSTKKHVSGNVVPCCIKCNKIKSNHSVEKFYKWVNDVYENKEKIKNIYDYVE